MEKNQALPKVLIFGETFRKNGGGGITLNTLFGDWPYENLFIINDRFGETSEIHFTQYYQLGNLENKSILHKLGFKTGNVSGRFITSKNNSENTITTQDNSLFKSKLYFRLKDLFILMLNKLGIYDFFFQQQVSKELIQWIEEIKPDIIYFQPSDFQNIKFINELHKLTGIPYAIHVMDNFLEISTYQKELNKKSILLLQQAIEELIQKSNLCLGICQEMSTQYSNQFNRVFYSFQHAVDPRIWFRNYKVRRDPQPFVILYAGRISFGTINSLFVLAQSIDNCNRENECNFEFQVQTTSPVPQLLKKLSKYQCVRIHDQVPYERLPDRYKEADLLVLPMDFDKKSLSYIKYSMPTKVPEYLSSGVPIFVLAPEITALYKYAKSANWAFLNGDGNAIKIENQLLEIRNNYNLRIEISETAQSVGQQNHDIYRVRESFNELITISSHQVL